MLKEIVKEFKMKQKRTFRLFVLLLVTFMMVMGCGNQNGTKNSVKAWEEDENDDREEDENDDEEEDEGENEEVDENAKVVGIRITEGAKYQYQPIDPRDIIVEYEGAKKDEPLTKYDGTYTTTTAIYTSNELGVYLDGEHFEATIDEYITYTDVDFTCAITQFDLWLLWWRRLDVNPALFKGVITYSDGHELPITAQEVELEYDGSYNFEVILTIGPEDRVGYCLALSEGMTILYEYGIPQSSEEMDAWYNDLVNAPKNDGKRMFTEDDLVHVESRDINALSYELADYKVEGDSPINPNINYGFSLESDNLKRLVTLIYEDTGCLFHTVEEEYFAIFEYEDCDYSAYIRLSDGRGVALTIVDGTYYAIMDIY